MGAERGRWGGPGPVFAFEWLTASRRWQGYAVRALFVSVLLAALVVAWSSRRWEDEPAGIRQLAAMGETVYIAVMGTQLALVLLAAPAATAGAICLDRARGALAHLLVTDLSDAEIVLGKLAARLVPVLGLVGGTLPVVALLSLLGGVDPDALFGAYLVTVGVALLGCSLALTCSLWAGKTHEALLGTYAVWGVWFLVGPVINELNGVTGLSVPSPPPEANPFYLIVAPYWSPGRVGLGDYLAFLGVTSAVSAALLALAVLRLRAVCAREGTRGGARSRRVVRLGWPGPSLDGNPVLWREWHRNRPSRWSRAVAGIYVTLAAVFSASVVVSGGVELAALVNGLQLAFGLLIFRVAASTALAEERVRGSLDVLMSTPLSTRQIVLGKWLGSFRFVPLLAVLPAVVAARGADDFWKWPGVGLLVVYVICSGAAVTSLGLALATWCSRPGRAVALTVGGYVLMTVAPIFLVLAMRFSEPFIDTVLAGSPFCAAVEITAYIFRPMGMTQDWSGAVLWSFAYAAAAVALLAATLATFNGCLGRVESGLDEFGPAWSPPGPAEEEEEDTPVGPGFAPRERGPGETATRRRPGPGEDERPCPR